MDTERDSAGYPAQRYGIDPATRERLKGGEARSEATQSVIAGLKRMENAPRPVREFSITEHTQRLVGAIRESQQLLSDLWKATAHVQMPEPPTQTGRGGEAAQAPPMSEMSRFLFERAIEVEAVNYELRLLLGRLDS